MEIIIKGNPIAKHRPRFSFKTGRAYSDQKHEENQWIKEAIPQITEKFVGVPIHIQVDFIMPRPKGHFGTGRNKDRIKDSAPVDHIVKPDADNLIKFVKDCLNGHAWHDDSQVVYMSALKTYQSKYNPTPETRIDIKRF